MAELDIRQRAFADAVGLKSNGSVSKILNGTEAVPPPLGTDLDRWAEILLIPDSELPRFRLMAYMGHMPDAVRPMMEALVDEHLSLKAGYANLLNEVRQIAAEHETLKKRYAEAIRDVRRVADAPTDDGSRRDGGA
jgi:hypothetical protein